MSYFIWKNTDSRSMGLMLREWPSLTGAETRTVQTTIPGRDGLLTTDDGSLQPLHLTLRCAVLPGYSWQRAREWLRGESLLADSRDPSRAWPARCDGHVTAETAGRWMLLTAEMTAMPYRVQRITPAPMLLEGDGQAVFNPGDRAAPAIITLMGSGEFWLTVGEVSVHMEQVERGICLNWQTGQVRMMNEQGLPVIPAENHVTGGPQLLPPGRSWISWSAAQGSIEQVLLQPDWRWDP